MRSKVQFCLALHGKPNADNSLVALILYLSTEAWLQQNKLAKEAGQQIYDNVCMTNAAPESSFIYSNHSQVQQNPACFTGQ